MFNVFRGCVTRVSVCSVAAWLTWENGVREEKEVGGGGEGGGCHADEGKETAAHNHASPPKLLRQRPRHHVGAGDNEDSYDEYRWGHRRGRVEAREQVKKQDPIARNEETHHSLAGVRSGE